MVNFDELADGRRLGKTWAEWTDDCAAQCDRIRYLHDPTPTRWAKIRFALTGSWPRWFVDQRLRTDDLVQDHIARSHAQWLGAAR